MKVTFKHLSLDEQKKYVALNEQIRLAKVDFLYAKPEETEEKRDALKKLWDEFVTATVVRSDVDLQDVNTVDMGEVIESFFAKVLIVPQ